MRLELGMFAERQSEVSDESECTQSVPRVDLDSDSGKTGLTSTRPVNRHLSTRSPPSVPAVNSLHSANVGTLRFESG